jgi:hypothetical protein
VEIVEMDADNVLEESNAARYQMLLKKSTLRYQKEMENLKRKLRE